MDILLNTQIDYKSVNGLMLAYIGDAVYELFVREKLLGEIKSNVNAMHKSSVGYVCCEAQSRAAKRIEKELTEEERAFFLRGRNAHPSHLPKNSSAADYHAATALEAVFGYLYTKNELERLKELFKLAVEEIERKED